MRLFVAVDLSDRVRRAVADASVALHDRLGRDAHELAWARPENLHLTIRFLGEVPDAEAESIRTALVDPVPAPPFVASLGRPGVFPAHGPVRVVWVGLVADGPRFERLQQQVASRLESVAISPETRPFHAHLTLARVRRPQGRVASGLRPAVAALAVEPASWLVDHVTLYRSRLKPGGSEYQPLLRTPLAGSPLESGAAARPD
jgi:2'-5' RNA ligase